MRRIIAVLALAALMAVAVVAPALAQPRQSGLVNVNVSGNTVQVPVGVAANICDINANVLAAQIAKTGSATCDAAVDQEL